MTNVTVRSLATEIQTSVEHLVQQFALAGIPKSANDSVTIQEKKTLLTYLNRKHNSSEPDKFTLQRKTRSTLNVLGTGGKSKSIQIEIRKSHIFVKNNPQNIEHLAIDNQMQCEIKEQTNCKIEKITEHQINLKTKYKSTEKTKQTTAKKNKTSDKQTNNITPAIQIKQSYQENGISERKHKTKKETHQLDEHKWQDVINTSKNTAYYRKFNCISSNLEEKNLEIKSSREVKNNYRRRERNTKNLRSIKKGNKNYESKINHEENYKILRDHKNTKYKNSALQHVFQKPVRAINRNVIIGETITVSELANKMAVKSSEVIKVMMTLGAMVTINQVIDQETAQLVAEEMGHKVTLLRENKLEEEIMSDRDIDSIIEKRAPIVTVMGHVDHGKTSLLDYIRSTKIASKEAGGITQHIGAYHVETENGMITFLDTPGHSAFTAMRARGVKITDIVVLVIAADDGIMPQTIEAIQHAKAAQVPIVVALNKIDKLNTDPNRIKHELFKNDIILEEWGGDCQFIPVSAKTGAGINELLNAILLQAAILELKTVHNGMASGVVIESFLDKNRGPIATVLVREGTLNKGDIILCGFKYGRIRAMRDELGNEIVKAGPSIPAEILGLSGVPVAGDEITVVRNEKKAREVALYRQGKFREIKLACQNKSKTENVFINKEINEVNIVLKTDLQGSLEAISDSVLNLSSEKINIKIIGSGVGNITETDATLALASNAILIGFNVQADSSARHIIETENIDLRYYSVIYNLIDELQARMNSMFSNEVKQQSIGLAEVRNVFKSPKFNLIAGCMVIEGIIKRHSLIHVLRYKRVVYKGEIESLRRFKDDVNEVRKGMECGIGIKNYTNIQVGDLIEVFEIVGDDHNHN